MMRRPGRHERYRWEDSLTAEALTGLLAHVRRKLERDPSHPTHFINEPGLGYRFEV